jgi:hypothetical protein
MMGGDEAELIRLWRENRGEVELEDLAHNLAVQLGAVTEDLIRRWYQTPACHQGCAKAPSASHQQMDGGQFGWAG